MKKFAAATALILTLAACGGKTVYVVETLPDEVTTTTQSAPTTTKPKPTTTAPRYIPPTNYYTFDEQAYIDGLYSLYSGIIYLTDDELLDMAYTICSTLDTGISLQAVITVLSTELSFASADTVEFLSALMASAIINLCPRHQWQIGSN